MRTASNAALYRPDLGIMVMEYVEGPTMGLIGLELMPLFPTPQQAASFPVIPKEALMSVPDVSRAPRGGYNRGDWKYERGLFQTQERGWEEPVDDAERSLFEQETGNGMADFIATRRATNYILKGQEKRIADILFSETYFTGHAVATEWNTAATATPIIDVKDGRAAFRSQCGMLPDALVISWTTFEDLKNCDEIVDRLKYTFPGIDINRMTSSQLAAVFDVPQVYIGGATYNTKGENIASVMADLWSSEYAALVKISRGQDMTEPGFGRTFLWTADSPQNPIVEQYRDEGVRSDIFRVRHNVDERLIRSYDNAGNVVSDIASSCVYLMKNIHT